jgi:hypothetical protein
MIFLGQFPFGISYQDFEELSNQEKIPYNWKELIYHLIDESPPLNDTYIDQNSGLELAKPNIIKAMSDEEFKPDCYIKLNIERDPVTHVLWFIPSQFICKNLENRFEEEFSMVRIKKLEYLACLSFQIIQIVTSNQKYNEKLVEMSLARSSGIWWVKFGPKFNPIINANALEYLTKLDFDGLRNLISRHEFNFTSCLELNFYKKIFSEESNIVLSF